MLFAEFDRQSFGKRDSLGGITVLADARIDDLETLCSKLGIARPIDDNELILEAYSRWGEQCVNHLIGDFAFVIVDAQRKQIFCARDHIGARPLFYALEGDQLRVASNINSLSDGIDREFDRVVVASVLTFNTYHPSNHTLLKHVKRLPPGHTLMVRPDRHELKRYWEPRGFPQLSLANDADYIEAGREVLKRAVSDRLRNIKQPAVHLTGGLDSSAVAALVTNERRRAELPDPPSYAWYLGNTDNPTDDETRWAEAARASLGLTMHAPPASTESLVALLRSDWSRGPDASNLLGEHAILEYSRSQGVDCILSGWGGDEGLSFNGRGYRADLLTSFRWRELAAICAGPFPISLIRGLRQSFHELLSSRDNPKTKRKLAASYLRRELAEDVELITPAPVSLRSHQQAMSSLLATGWQTARIEDWAIAGQSYGITYSYPMLDRRVLEFALSLPGNLFYRPEARRWIMRKVLDPKLPDLIRWNDSKLELARVTHFQSMMAQAFRQCADLIEDCRDFAGTDQIVDVERLINDLRGPEENLLDNFSSKRRSLQFLSF